MSTYLIGDIQGCYESLQRLLEKIAFDPAKDQLWSCGDLVNRGCQSLEVLRLLRSMGDSVSVTLGNHDLHLLAYNYRLPGSGARNEEFDAVLAAPDRDDIMEWLCAHPLAIFSEKHQMLRVHAGVIPQWTWQDAVSAGNEITAVLQSDQREKFLSKMYGNKPKLWRDERTGWGRLRLISNILTRLRFCDEMGRGNFRVSGPPGCEPDGYRAWYKHKHRKTRDIYMAFGHWAAMGLRIKKRFIALDSGCVWGGKLSAYRLEDKQLFQVRCR